MWLITCQRKTSFKLFLDKNNIAAKSNIAINLNKKQQWKKKTQKNNDKNIYGFNNEVAFFFKLPNESKDMKYVLFFCFAMIKHQKHQ